MREDLRAQDPMAERETADILAPYRELARLAERELELARAGELELLMGLAEHRRRLRTQIDQPHPAGGAGLLALAAGYTEEAGVELERHRALLVREMSVSANASRAARGYGAQGHRALGLDRRA